MEAFSRTKASLVLTVCKKGVPSTTSMILDRSKPLGIPKPFCVEAVRGRYPQHHKAGADAGTGIHVHQGLPGADGVRDRWP